VPDDMRYAATARPKVERPLAALISAASCASYRKTMKLSGVAQHR
jgi:hypothetical protein